MADEEEGYPAERVADSISETGAAVSASTLNSRRGGRERPRWGVHETGSTPGEDMGWSVPKRHFTLLRWGLALALLSLIAFAIGSLVAASRFHTS
jgi:hypothetical protein